MRKRPTLACWIEAMRLRTLPVSLASVVVATGLARMSHSLNITVTIICFLFAILAQIASNFGNEYFDYRDGLDRVGRDGPRRGVTEGDITPRAMLTATLVTLGAACVVGLSLLLWGPWWIVPIGIFIALGVLSYSTGPYPLSRHGLGEVAVILFFGVIPVNLTYYLQATQLTPEVVAASVSIGLMGANVLIVNNYRDIDDDRAVGKRTLAVILGRKPTLCIYCINGYLALLLMCPTWLELMHRSVTTLIVPIAYLTLHTLLCRALSRRTGRQLNPMLGMTAMLMALYAVGFLIAA